MKCIYNTDVVHARGDIPALAALLSRKAPVLWDIRGMWSEQRIVIESNIIKKIVFRMFILLRRIMLNRVDSITTLSSVHDNYLIDKYGRVPLNRNVISTCVETEKFGNIKNMPEKVNILISGTYNNYYDRESTSTFINEFYQQYKIPLDPIYTGKMVFGVLDLIEKKWFPDNSKILLIHTGGLQGIAGMNHLLRQKKQTEIIIHD